MSLSEPIDIPPPPHTPAVISATLRDTIQLDCDNDDDAWTHTTHAAPRLAGGWDVVFRLACMRGDGPHITLAHLALPFVTLSCLSTIFIAACRLDRLSVVQLCYPRLGVPYAVFCGFQDAARKGHVRVCDWLFRALSVLRVPLSEDVWDFALSDARDVPTIMWLLETSHDPCTPIQPLSPTVALCRAAARNDLTLAQRVGAFFLRHDLMIDNVWISCHKMRAKGRMLRWLCWFLPSVKCLALSAFCLRDGPGFVCCPLDDPRRPPKPSLFRVLVAGLVLRSAFVRVHRAVPPSLVSRAVVRQHRLRFARSVPGHNSIS